MLALALGIWDVDSLRESMPKSIMDKWIAFFNLHPFGEERDDMRMARICEVVARSGGAKSVSPSDFMFDFIKAREEKDGAGISPQNLEAFFVGIKSAIDMAGGM